MTPKAAYNLKARIQPGHILLVALTAFLCLLIASESSKLTNNFFYIALLPVALALIYRKSLKPNAFSLTLASYLLYIAISTFWGNSELEVSLKQLKYVIYIVAFIVIAHYVSRSKTRITIISATILALALALEAQSLYAQISAIGFDSWIGTFPRLSTTTGPLNPVYLALIIGLFGFILISIHTPNPWVATGLVFLLIILTLPLQSRTVIVALTASYSYLLLRQRNFLILSIWAGLCALAGLAMLTEVDRFTSSIFRDDIWAYTINAWTDNCSVLLGCGNRYNFNIETQGRYFYNPHSILLSQLLYGGVVGFSLIAALFYTAYKKACVMGPAWPAIWVFSVSASATIGHTILTHPDFIWILIWLPLSFSGALFSCGSSVDVDLQENQI